MKTVALLLVAASFLFAQSPVFEVASIKPNLSGSGSSSFNDSHGRFTAENISLKILIQAAFDIKDFQIIAGPNWLEDAKYDINAKTDSSVNTDKEFEPPLQALLADRFGFKFHRETRELSVFSLSPAKGGAKLTAHTGDGGPSTRISSGAGKANMTAIKATPGRLADMLGRILHRTVVDNTGLSGDFDFKLDWSPDPTPDSSGPSIYTAVQEQLGLKLESQKAPIEVIVIESVGKPSEN